MRKETPEYGASMLADTVAKEDHYPVKQRRRPRRLNPNWAGIAWLEAQSMRATETVGVPVYLGEGLEVYIAAGRSVAARHGHPRPMFQVFELSVSSALRRNNLGTPCPGCDDWSRTAQCEQHPAEHYDPDCWLGYGEELTGTLTPAPRKPFRQAPPEQQYQEIVQLFVYARGTRDLHWDARQS